MKHLHADQNMIQRDVVHIIRLSSPQTFAYIFHELSIHYYSTRSSGADVVGYGLRLVQAIIQPATSV
jgi:hypothetical protein